MSGFRYRVRYVVEERREVVIQAPDPDAALCYFNRHVDAISEDGTTTIIGREIRKTLTYVDGTEA